MRPEQRSGVILPGVASSEGARLGGEAAQRLARTGQYEIGPGLTDAEFARIEGDYGFEFAGDHRAFLAAGLPLNRPPEEGRPGSARGLTGVTAIPTACSSSSAGPSMERFSMSSATPSGIRRGGRDRPEPARPWTRRGSTSPGHPR